MSLRQTLIRILQSGESTLQANDELQYLRIENQRLLGIIETLAKGGTKSAPAPVRAIENPGPFRVGRPVMTRTSMRQLAQIELNRINKEKDNVVEGTGGNLDGGKGDGASREAQGLDRSSSGEIQE